MISSTLYFPLIQFNSINRYCTCRPIYMYHYISLSDLWNEKCVRQKIVDKIKTHILGSVTLFFRKSCLYEVMWKNTVQPDRPQMIILVNYGYKHILWICNTFCFSTAKMVEWERLDITLYVHWLSWFYFIFPLKFGVVGESLVHL